VERFASVGVLLAVEVLVRLESRIAGVTELSGLLVGRRVAGLGTFSTLGMRIQSHEPSIPTAPLL
jgi:hypothetical protein